MDPIKFSGGAVLTPSETGKKGVYHKDGKSVDVTIQGIDAYGGATFTTPRGQFYQSGSRAVRLNALTAPVYSPRILPERKSAPGNPPTAGRATGWRRDNMNRQQILPVAREYRLGPGAGWARKIGETPPPPQTSVMPWVARGSNVLPQNPGFSGTLQAKTLIDVTVPTGYKLRLAQYALFLSPSDAWEDNLVWKLIIGGTDVFNPFNLRQGSRQIFAGLGLAANNLWTGRPARSNIMVPFSFLKDDLITVEPNTRITLTVEAVSSWPGGPAPTDIIGAAIWGSLWGVKS